MHPSTHRTLVTNFLTTVRLVGATAFKRLLPGRGARYRPQGCHLARARTGAFRVAASSAGLSEARRELGLERGPAVRVAASEARAAPGCYEPSWSTYSM